MNQVQIEILNYLERNARGATNAVNADTIQANVNTDPGRTQEPTRDLIRDMVMEHSARIGSSSRGYFIIVTQADLDIALRYLENRIEPLRTRAEVLKLIEI